MEQGAILEATRQFRQVANYRNPPYCSEVMVEQAYFNHWSATTAKSKERIYLPIFWTNEYVHGGYRSNPKLQAFLNNLPRDQQYYTVIQYDDGILENIDGLDLLIFSAGHPVGVPIPLLPSHMPIKAMDKPKIMQTYACFNDTHYLRTKAKQVLKNNPTISWADQRPWQEYLRSIDNYAFCLAPRGYGVASFRMYEAIMLGSVPIYLSDIYWLPFRNEIDYFSGGLFLRNEQDLSESILFTDIISKSFFEYQSRALKENIMPFITMDYTVNYIHEYARK